MRRTLRPLLALALVATAGIAALLLVPTQTTAAASTTSSSASSNLLSSLRYYEVVHVRSPTHILSGPAHARTVHTTSYTQQQQPSATAADQRPTQHPDTHQLTFTAHGQQFDVRLYKNAHLFGPRYSETRQAWNEAGQRVREMEAPAKPLSLVEHCFYRGGLGDQGVGAVAMHTCGHGFSGVVHVFAGTNGGSDQTAQPESYMIEPAHEHLTSPQLVRHLARLQSVSDDEEVNVHALHVVYKLSDAMNSPHAETLAAMTAEASKLAASSEDGETLHVPHCGVDHPQVNQVGIRANVGRSSNIHAMDGGLPFGGHKKAALPTTRYVELFVANDQLRYAALGQNTEFRSANIVNTISALYHGTAFTPTLLEVVLVGQVTFFMHDPWNVTLGGCSTIDTEVCVDKLLPLWNEWRRNPDNTQPYEFNDAGHLFSGHDFQTSVLGYAGVGSMCYTSTSGGINQMTDTNDASNGAIGAHELGHNLGMQHDNPNTNAACPESGFIMNAKVTLGSPPTQFSVCSKNYYTSFVNNGGGSCLDNPPTTRYGDPICGNGYVEVGEACDCGPYGPGIDSTNVDAGFCAAAGNPCCDPLSCQFTEEAACSEADPCCSGCQITPKSENKMCRAASNMCDVAETCDGVSSACPVDDNIGNGAKCELAPYGQGACFEGDCMSFARQCAEMSRVITGGPYLPCPYQESINTQSLKPPQTYCGQLFCTTQERLDTNSRLCDSFTLSSAPERLADGVACGRTDAYGNRASTDLCYSSTCTPAEDTNVRYQWAADEWSSCTSCDSSQNRSVSCVHVATGEASNDVYCTASARPPSVQRCNSDELLCEHGIEGSISVTILGHEVKINTALVMGVSAGVFVFLLGIMHWCVNVVKKKPEDIHKQKRRDAREAAGRGQPAGSPKAAEPASRAAVIAKNQPRRSQVKSSFLVV